jgi:hypothetical protein
MKTAFLAAAILCLLGALWSSWAYFLGDVSREVFLRQFGMASLGWFAAATWWAYKK